METRKLPSGILLSLLVMICLCWFGPIGLFGQEGCPEGFESLFNGKDLSGWKVHEQEKGGKWFVEEGAIVGVQDPPGSGGFLRTEKTYKDFELLLETQIEWPFDSGIFLRVGPDAKSHQVTLDYRPEGNIGKIYCPWTQDNVFWNPDGIRYFKKEAWNTMRIVCQGEPARIRVWLNGALITDFQHTVASTKGIPTEGTICLQIHPGGKGFDKAKAQFRNLYIREIGPDPKRTEGLNNSTFSNTGDEQGYISLFNGKDLTGWDGDPRLWSVQKGVIHGQTTEQNPIDENTFCIWRAGAVRNFILKLKFRIPGGGNSGVQYRSYDQGLWSVSGYQAEVCNCPDSIGFLYDEGLRARLADPMQFVEVNPEGQKEVVGSVLDPEIYKTIYKEADWNDYTIVARGNHIVHYVNGVQTIELIDNGKDYAKCHKRGTIALQMHKGDPMVVEFKDIYVKHLSNAYGPARRLFSGKDLQGWEFSSEDVRPAWSVKDGVLANAGKPNGYIKTAEDFTSYVLRMQFRHLEKGNSGVLMRITGPDKVWPRCVEAQLMFGSVGDIFVIDQFPVQSDPDRRKDRKIRKFLDDAEKPLGQWNEYEIVLDKGNLSIFLNGLLQNSAWECDLTPGKIAIQSEGAPMEYRNIVLIPISK